MILASHNTMTYLEPSNKWLKPFTFMARCQKLHIIDQYEAGARMFDFRFVFDKWGEPSFAHGSMKFRADITIILNTLIWLDNKAKDEDIWVRVLNERNENYDTFISYCKYLKNAYPHIKFFGGINKKDWKQLYDFGYGDPEFVDKYSSNNYDHLGLMTGWFWDDLWPWIYAKFHNKKWRKKYADYDGYLMQDFVGVI